MSTTSAVMADIPYQPKQHREKLKGRPKPKQQPYKSNNRYSGIRSVVCEQLGFKYRAVDAPRDVNELRSVTHTYKLNGTSDQMKEQESGHRAKRLFRRRSWEVLTERSLGQG